VADFVIACRNDSSSTPAAPAKATIPKKSWSILTFTAETEESDF
jgi:hypothetical protein